MSLQRLGIMANAQACALAFEAKRQPLGCLFLRLEVPWIKKHKLVDQTKN